MTGTRNDIAESLTDSSQVPCLKLLSEAAPQAAVLADTDASADAVGCSLLCPYIDRVFFFLTGSGWNLTANPAWP